ncbi:MAG: Mu-like prophage major head subunit gpT family protein [Planctomycetaceae bacterium]
MEQLRAQAVAEEITFSAYQSGLLECIRAERPNAGGNFRPAGLTPPTRDILEAGLHLRAGQEAIALQAFGERTVEAARKQGIGSLVDLCRATLRAEGLDLGAAHHDAVIRAAFSTASLPTVLANTLGRTMVGIDRRVIVNDDLGFVQNLAPALGRAAARSLNDLLWEMILGGETATFFATAKGNLLEAPSDLSVASLGLAVATMRQQRDSRGSDIQMEPVALVVSPTLELTARALLNSTEILGTTGVNGNPGSRHRPESRGGTPAVTPTSSRTPTPTNGISSAGRSRMRSSSDFWKVARPPRSRPRRRVSTGSGSRCEPTSTSGSRSAIRRER